MANETSKPYPGDSLRGILKQKHPELFNSLETNWKNAKKNLLDYLTEEGFTTHGLAHCEGIEDKLEELIPDDVKQNMTALEIYILLNAVLYHDMGMADKKYPNEPLNKRRKEHAERSASIINEKYLELGLLDKAIAKRVAEVARGHGTESLDEFREDDYINFREANKDDKKVNTKFLVSLLRLGDLCDWSRERAPLFIGDLKWISGESYKYWREHNLIESIYPDSKQKLIKITGLPKGKWTQKWLGKLIQWVNAELKINIKTLKSRGVIYTGFELRINSDTPSPIPRAGTNPFQFLKFYDSTSQDLFFGREQEIEEFVGKLFNNRVNILVGQSGVGKTSFLLAGVCPAMREYSFATVYMDDYLNASEGLRQQLHSRLPLNFETTSDLLGSLTLATQETQRVLIILDQFEKNFMPQENEPFLEELSRIIPKKDIEVRIVFSLRREYVDYLWQFSNRYNLNLLGMTEYRTGIYRPDAKTVHQIIEESLRAANLQFEKSVIEAIIDELDYKHRSDLAFFQDLQIICGSLAEHLLKHKSSKLTMVDYSKLGKCDGLITAYFSETIWKGFAPSEYEEARKLIVTLVDSEGGRLQRTMQEIIDEVGCQPEDAQRIISQFTESRLIKEMADKDQTENVRYELIHDLFAKTIPATEKLMTEKEKNEKSALETWNAVKRDWKSKKLQMGVARLEYLGKYASGFDLSEDDKKMVLQNMEKVDYIDSSWCQIFDEPWHERIFAEYINMNPSNRQELFVWCQEINDLWLWKKITLYSQNLPQLSKSEDAVSSLLSNISVSAINFVTTWIVDKFTDAIETAFQGNQKFLESKEKTKKERFYRELLTTIGITCMGMLEEKLTLVIKDFKTFKQEYQCAANITLEHIFWLLFSLMNDIGSEQTFRILVKTLSLSNSNKYKSMILRAMMACKDSAIWASLPQNDLDSIAKSADIIQLLEICGIFLSTKETQTTCSNFAKETLSEKFNALQESRKIKVLFINEYRDTLVQLGVSDVTVQAMRLFRKTRRIKEKTEMLEQSISLMHDKSISSGKKPAALASILEGLNDKNKTVEKKLVALTIILEGLNDGNKTVKGKAEKVFKDNELELVLFK